MVGKSVGSTHYIVVIISTKKVVVQVGMSWTRKTLFNTVSLFTKACQSLIMMLEPRLEVVVENVITGQTTCKLGTHYLVLLLTVTWFPVQSSIILYTSAPSRKKQFPTLQV